jgi:protein-tyrosine phosphatase
MAEAVFQKMVDEAGLSREIEVDSAGTGSWHVGEKAHRGTRRVLAQHDFFFSRCAWFVRSVDFED